MIGGETGSLWGKLLRPALLITDSRSNLKFADRLAQLRKEREFGVRELGRLCSCTGMHISNMEKGKSLPSPEMLRKLAAALEADIDELAALADQIDPDVTDLIKREQSVPSFLRSAKDLSPDQWAELQKMVEIMKGAPGGKAKR